jgi:hypothetical protein
MCLEIELSRKAQPANHGFPEGWKFAFESSNRGVENLQGLVLIPPTGSRRYFSVEGAMNHHKSMLRDVKRDL